MYRKTENVTEQYLNISGTYLIILIFLIEIPLKSAYQNLSDYKTILWLT